MEEEYRCVFFVGADSDFQIDALCELLLARGGVIQPSKNGTSVRFPTWRLEMSPLENPDSLPNLYEEALHSPNIYVIDIRAHYRECWLGTATSDAADLDYDGINEAMTGLVNHFSGLAVVQVDGFTWHWRVSDADVLPIPSHVAEWLDNPRLVDGYGHQCLTGILRCPCGCAELELYFPGATHMAFGTETPTPCTAEYQFGQDAPRFYFGIKVICARCRVERNVFDSNLHGHDAVISRDSEYARHNAALPQPALWPWRCLMCDARPHRVTTSFFIDDPRDFLHDHGHRFRAAQRGDLFGAFDMDIVC